MKTLLGLIAAASILCCGSPVVAQETAQIDSDSLQLAFATTKDLIVEPNWHALPDDIRRLLDHAGESFIGAKPGFANIGEVWSDLDFIVPQYPARLHVYSAYSDDLTASLFITGGNQERSYILLAYRRAPNFCIFKMKDVPNLAIFHIREMQSLVQPNRDTTIQPIPKCRPQSLRLPLDLTEPWAW